MIQVNKFIEDLKPSSTLAINQKVQELRHNGNSVFHFGFGQSPFPIHNSITAALTEHVKDNSYLPTIGLEPLRKQISVLANQPTVSSWRVSRGWVCGCGCWCR